jgi:MerR family mercuric resistance operon transcriptional regulator
MNLLTIGKVAKQAGIGVETVRFYERQGVISQPSRRQSGYRQYPPETVTQICFVKRAKELGFTLKEIKSLLSLRASPESPCSNVRRQAEAKIAGVQQKIRDLRKIEKALRKLLTACSGRGPVTACPILDAMEGRPREDRTSRQA